MPHVGTGLPREVEGTLAIQSEVPDETARRLGDLREVAGYRLRPCPTRRLRDAYLDNRPRDLGRRRIALRLREVDGEVLVALKADSHVTEVATDRVEIESPWSPAAFDAVREELARRGVETPQAQPNLEKRKAEEVLREAGFVPVQERETMRIPREVIPETGGEPEAELVVDTVAYRFDREPVRFHEVEVEARARGNAETVGRVLRALVDLFPAELRAWPYGKLATGEAIRALREEGRLDGLVDPDGTLAVKAYDLLAARLDGETPRSHVGD